LQGTARGEGQGNKYKLNQISTSNKQPDKNIYWVGGGIDGEERFIS